MIRYFVILAIMAAVLFTLACGDGTQAVPVQPEKTEVTELAGTYLEKACRETGTDLHPAGGSVFFSQPVTVVGSSRVLGFAIGSCAPLSEVEKVRDYYMSTAAHAMSQVRPQPSWTVGQLEREVLDIFATLYRGAQFHNQGSWIITIPETQKGKTQTH